MLKLIFILCTVVPDAEVMESGRSKPASQRPHAAALTLVELPCVCGRSDSMQLLLQLAPALTGASHALLS
jgi:hypothetical protein